MSLENWLQSGYLLKHEPTVAEIAQLCALAVVDRELSDASAQGLSADGKFTHAYNAVLQLCAAALSASGYRVGKMKGHHHYIINSLEHTLGKVQQVNMIYFSRCSQQCSHSLYDYAGVVEQQDADDLLKTAQHFRNDVLNWLRTAHPRLLLKNG